MLCPYGRIKHQLNHLERLLQLDWLKIVVKVNVASRIDEVERGLIVENRPIETCFEEILFSPIIRPEIVVSEVVAEDVAALALVSAALVPADDVCAFCSSLSVSMEIWRTLVRL